MKHIGRVFLVLAWCGLAAFETNAAGFSSSSTSSGEVARFTPEEIIHFAKKVEKTLAAEGARVAILARMGRPPSELPERMHFTHVAFALYSEITTSDNRKVPGYAIYNLYQQNDHPEVSDLAQDYPVDFFAGVAQFEAGVIYPRYGRNPNTGEVAVLAARTAVARQRVYLRAAHPSRLLLSVVPRP